MYFICKRKSSSSREGDDLEAVAFGDSGAFVLCFEKGGLIVLDDDGLVGEAEFGEEGENGFRFGFGALAVELNLHRGLFLQNGFIPIFPNGFEAGGRDGFGEVGGGALVVDSKLLGGAGAGRFFFFGDFDAAAFLGAVEVVTTGSGVTAGVGGAASGHVRGPEGHHVVAEGGRLPGGDHDAGGGEAQSSRGNQLHQLAVREVAVGVGGILVVPGVGSHAGECDRELSLPTMLVQVFQMGGEGESLSAPVSEAEEGTNTDAAETSSVSAFGTFEAPVEILFGSSGVKGFIGVAVVGLLVDDEAFGTGFDEFGVLVVFHGADFDADSGEERC